MNFVVWARACRWFSSFGFLGMLHGLMR